MIAKQYFQYLLRKYGLLSVIGFALLIAAFLFYTLLTSAVLKKSQYIKSVTMPEAEATKVVPREDLNTSISSTGNFYNHLPNYAELGGKLNSIFEAAANNELVVDQVEYKLEIFNQSQFARYHIVLPLTGGYVNIRKFINMIMQNNPTLSLDHISFDKESTSDSLIDVKLDLSLYLLADHK